jgi:hypothetical protein
VFIHKSIPPDRQKITPSFNLPIHSFGAEHSFFILLFFKSCAHLRFNTPHFNPSYSLTTFIMRSSISILTLLSASLVVAAPAPFQGRGPVVAAGTEGVVMPTTNFGRREAAVVEDFSKRALKLRGALVAARNGQGKSNDNGNADAQAADDEAGQDAAAAEDAAQGKGKNADKKKGMFPLELLRGFATNSMTEQDQAAQDDQAAADAQAKQDAAAAAMMSQNQAKNGTAAADPAAADAKAQQDAKKAEDAQKATDDKAAKEQAAADKKVRCIVFPFTITY